eukprot:6185648-Pleurochrysis_carterae.AAC.2
MMLSGMQEVLVKAGSDEGGCKLQGYHRHTEDIAFITLRPVLRCYRLVVVIARGSFSEIEVGICLENTANCRCFHAVLASTQQLYVQSVC